MSLDTSNAGLARRYDQVAYQALPHRLTHPDRLAAVATFLGMTPPRPAASRVLEVGCSDGGNLIPMALGLPRAQFVGCDLSARAIASARRTAAAAGVENIRFLEQDLGALDPAYETFDYIIAHGVYSWVPARVRDALFALARQRLASNGVMYVSFNALPGCRVRQAAWDILHHHVDHLADPHERIAAARRLAGVLAGGGKTQFESDDAVRAELRAIAGRSDSEIFHDDLAVPNDPVYFRDFAAHAERYDLAYLAEAELHSMSAAGISADARELFSTLAPLEREQYLDFARFRRFRQSLLRRSDAKLERSPDARWLAGLSVAADASLMQAASEGRIDAIARGLDPAGGDHGPVRGLLDSLARKWPASVASADLQSMFAADASRPLAAVITDAYVGNLVDLHVDPPRLTTIAGERPLASPLARVQSRTQQDVTTLRHTRIALPDPNARRLLVLLDGAHDRTALADAMRDDPRLREPKTAAAFVEHALGQFARLALLVPEP